MSQPIVLTPTMREAIKVNAERDHFAEAYEGFNDCESRNGGICDCGKDEAEVAWAEIQDMEDEAYVKESLK